MYHVRPAQVGIRLAYKRPDAGRSGPPRTGGDEALSSRCLHSNQMSVPAHAAGIKRCPIIVC